METRIIDSRNDFAQWAIDRSNAILTDQGSELATAARKGNEAEIAETAQGARPSDRRCPDGGVRRPRRRRMNHRLAGTTGCANGNDGRYVRSQIHPAIMISDCAESASAASREPRSSCASSKATRPSTSSGYPTSMSLAR